MRRAKTAAAAVGSKLKREGAEGSDTREDVKARVRDTVGKVMPTDQGGVGKIKDQVKLFAGEAQNGISSAQHQATTLRRFARLHGSAIKRMGQLKELYGHTFGKDRFVAAGKAEQLEGVAVEQANR